MKIKYNFNLGVQFFTGFVSFLSTVIVTSLIGKVDWVLSISLGILQFIISGFYNKCK